MIDCCGICGNAIYPDDESINTVIGNAHLKCHEDQGEQLLCKLNQYKDSYLGFLIGGKKNTTTDDLPPSEKLDATRNTIQERLGK